MNDKLMATAKSVASRCNNAVQFFGFDDAMLSQFIATLIMSLVGNCFGSDNPKRVQRIVRLHTATPKKKAKFIDRCEERVNEKYIREHDEALPDDVSEDIALAMIDECLEASNEDVAAVCAVVSDAEFGE